jgi:hypothetical protein
MGVGLLLLDYYKKMKNCRKEQMSSLFKSQEETYKVFTDQIVAALIKLANTQNVHETMKEIRQLIV